MAKKGTKLTEEQKEKIRKAHQALRQGQQQQPMEKAVKGTPQYDIWLQKYRMKVPQKSEPVPIGRTVNPEQTIQAKEPQIAQEPVVKPPEQPGDVSVPRTEVPTALNPRANKDPEPESLDISIPELEDFNTGIQRYHLNPSSELFTAEKTVYGMLRDMEKNQITVDTLGLSGEKMSVISHMDAMKNQFGNIEGNRDGNGNYKYAIENDNDVIRFMDSKGIPIKKITRTGKASISIDVLRPMIKQYPDLDPIVKYREAEQKLRYLDRYLNYGDKVSTHLSQFKTTTGRIYSDDVNLQQIPKSLRKYFKAPEGKTYIYADQKQFEYRIHAGLAREQKLIDMFNAGVDVHRKSMSEIMGIPEDQVTDEMRNLGKVLGYSVLYGGTGFGISLALGIPESQAEVFLNKYYETFPNMKKFTTMVRQLASKTKKVVTYFGRNWYLTDNDLIKERSSKTLRQAVNYVSQGGGADILKLHMARLKDPLTRIGSRIVLPAHDAVLVECDNQPDKVDQVSKQLKEVMNDTINGCKLDVGIKSGTTFDVMK